MTVRDGAFLAGVTLLFLGAAGLFGWLNAFYICLMAAGVLCLIRWLQ
jgi:hypothetical protein